MRLARSPTARGWPLTNLRPSTRHDALHYEVSNPVGCTERLRVVQLLRLTGKQPQEFVAIDDGQFACEGPSYDLISEPWAESTKPFCHKLTTLQLELAYCHKDSTPRPKACLHHVKCLLENTSALEQLSLEIPWETEDNQILRYPFAEVFPPAPLRQFTKLKSFRLLGLTTSFHDLAELIFLSLPILECLQIGHIKLTDGHWDDMIEGLRQLCSLRKFEIIGLMMNGGNSGYFGQSPNVRFFDKEYKEFISAACRYVMQGGRHPSVPSDKPDDASSIYLSRLKEALI